MSAQERKGRGHLGPRPEVRKAFNPRVSTQ